jgi:phage host-nuclease inhibitor protein Gam
MPRKAQPKPAAPAVQRPKTWDDVDALVHLMARADADVADFKASADEKVRAVGAGLQKQIAPLLALREALEDAVETFASGHRRDFGDARSMALAHGRLGWRSTPPAVKLLRPAEEILALLKERGLGKAILVTERPSKDILATYPEDLLRELGVRVTQHDDFFVEFAEAGVSQAPAG